MSSRHMMSFGIAICVLAAIAALVWPVHSDRARAAPETSPPQAPSVAVDASSSSQGFATRTQLAPRGATAVDEWVVSVRGPDRQPLPSAELLLVRPSRREVPRDSVVARADEEGVVRVRELIVDEDRVPVVHAAGYLPARIDPSAHTQTVILERGHPADVRVTDRSGRPLVGAAVSVGVTDGGPLAGIEHPVDPLPGFPSRIAIHTCRTDEQGHAHFDGLAAGRYFLDVTHPTMVVDAVDGADGTGAAGLAVPGRSWSVTMAPVYAGVVVFEDDDVVAYSYRLNGSIDATRTPDTCPGVQSLRRAHPGDWVIALVPTAAAVQSGSPITITHRFLLRASGWRSINLELAPLDTLEPLPVHTSATTPLCHPVIIQLEPPLPAAEGHPRPWFALRGNFDGENFAILTDVGATVHLPPGTIHVLDCAPYLRKACRIPKEFEVDGRADAPQTVSVAREQELTASTLEFDLPDGPNVGSLTDVSLVHESGAHLYWSFWNSQDAHNARGMDRRVWLLPGTYNCWAKHPLLGKSEMSVIVPATTGVVDVTFRWAQR